MPASAMILTTTPSVEGHRMSTLDGVVVGEANPGANVVRDPFAGITDIIGRRSSSYERSLQEDRDTAMGELAERARAADGNAAVGIDPDCEVVGSSMLMVSGSGTSATIEVA